MASPEVSAPIVRALIDEARGKNYPGGVLGIRTQPAWSGPDSFLHEGVPVTVVPCVSALAVHEALLRRSGREWLVILTDRPEEDLGASVLTHLLWHRLRTPDPWEAVRRRFAATGIDPALTAGARHRDLATGLLAATPSKGTPPAPAGVLTRDHAFASVAARHLGVPGPDLDGEAVLAWTADPAATTSVADLRAVAGDAVTDALLEWMAQAAGPAQGPLLALLRAGQAGDAVPLGLVVGVLVAARAATAVTAGQAPRVAGQQQTAREALIRLEPRLGGSVPAEPALLSWAADASRVVVERLGNETTRPQAERLLARADELLAGGQASTLAGISDVLPSGLTRRLADLATALRAATTEHGPATGQAPAGQAPAGCWSSGTGSPRVTAGSAPSARPYGSPDGSRCRRPPRRPQSRPPRPRPPQPRPPQPRPPRPWPHWYGGTVTSTAGSTPRSTTQCAGSATPSWGPAWPPCSRRSASGAAPTTPPLPAPWWPTLWTTRHSPMGRTPASGTWRTCCPASFSPWRRPLRRCYSSWTG